MNSSDFTSNHFPSNQDNFDEVQAEALVDFNAEVTHLLLIWTLAILGIVAVKGTIIFCLYQWYANRHRLRYRQPPTTISAQPVVPGRKYSQ